MKFYDMPDKTADAGGPGFETIAVREVRVPHPTERDTYLPAYEVEIELDAAEVARITAGARLRICLLSRRVIPIQVSVVAEAEPAPTKGRTLQEKLDTLGPGRRDRIKAEADRLAAEPVDPVRPIICNCGKPRAASEVSWGHGVAYCGECIPH